MHIKKNDTVAVISGKYKDKQGVVVSVLPKENKVMVAGIAVVVRHQKQRKQNQPSAIKKMESYIDASKVMPVCSACHKPTRINFTMTTEDKKVRTCNRCKSNF